MGDKRFKDPIYGYVEIEEDFITQVVDTAVFQRLRDVIQTSYSPLYSSAVHNRFVHSIGVYHLGKIASKAFYKSYQKQSLHNILNIKQYIKIFELACLLHDVGHAPFSHTGEQFYLLQGKRSRLHEIIVQLSCDRELQKDIEDNSYKAAPHELMSVIVALQEFSDIIPDDKKGFFARCITGYRYSGKSDIKKSSLNCLIELLNSKIIDVDKMDYLIRDSYMAGFNTTSIDYVRLLESICLVEKEESLKICFNKHAVSAIENVVYAHDAERKWTQNHPTVLYEAYVIGHVMEKIMEQIFETDQLTEDFLSVEGVKTKKLGRVSLMGDSDLLYLMKNLDEKSFAKEYYDRNSRKHPLWKSEAEFQAIFKDQEDKLNLIEREFEELKKFLKNQGLPFVINETALNVSKKERNRLQRKIKKAMGLEQQKLLATLEANTIHIEWIRIFEQFAKARNIDFDFLVIYADQFISGFRKPEFGDIEIVFPELKDPCKFKEISNILTSKDSKAEKFFFIYYNRKDKRELSISDLIQKMLEVANKMLSLEDRNVIEQRLK